MRTIEDIDKIISNHKQNKVWTVLKTPAKPPLVDVYKSVGWQEAVRQLRARMEQFKK